MRVSDLKRGKYFWFNSHGWGGKRLLARRGGRNGHNFIYITYATPQGCLVKGALLTLECDVTLPTDADLLAARLTGHPLLTRN